MTIHEPDAIVALTGTAPAGLAWSTETVDGKGRLKMEHHSLRLTPGMLPMLMAAASVLLTEQASLATCFDGDES